MLGNNKHFFQDTYNFRHYPARELVQLLQATVVSALGWGSQRANKGKTRWCRPVEPTEE